jgi:hypothetical protein
MNGDSRSVALDIGWHRPVSSAVAARGMEAAIQVIFELADVFDVEFRVEAGAGRPTGATFIVEGADAAHATGAAAQAREVLQGFNPWLGLADPEMSEALDDTTSTFDLVNILGPGRRVLHEFAPAWTVAASQPSRTLMRMRIHRQNPGIEEPPTVTCSVSIHGDSGDAATVAAVLAGELSGEKRFASKHRRSGHEGVVLDLPLDVACWLLSTPARISDAWPTSPIAPAGEVLSKFLDAIPPHTAVFGGSGLGKTTLTEHRIAAQLSRGPVVVLCPHGDLPARAAAILQQAGVAFDAVDFGHELAPRWSVFSPPGTVAVDEWLDVVPEVVLARWKDKHDLSGAMAGPMWHFAFMAAGRLLALDPDGPWPITRVAELLTQPLDGHWSDVSGRLDAPEALAQLHQVRDAIENDREKHFAPWLLSKLSMFTSNSRMRRIVDNRTSSFDVSHVFDGRSLLVAAPQSLLGDDGASVILTAILHQLWSVARRRPPGARRRTLVVIDEAQLIDPAITMTLLTQGRKFGIELMLATQSPRHLDEALRNAVLANTGVIGTFRIGPADAALLDMKFPTVPIGAMQRLPKFVMAATDGDSDVVGPTAGPLVDPDDVAPLDRAHRRTLASQSQQSASTGRRSENLEPTDEPNNDAAPRTNSDPFLDVLHDWPSSWAGE